MATRNDIFANVQIGEVFYVGGNTCQKKTTRTADVCIGKDNERRFWFRQSDNVTVG